MKRFLRLLRIIAIACVVLLATSYAVISFSSWFYKSRTKPVESSINTTQKAVELSPETLLAEVNVQRQLVGALPLKLNESLNQSAMLKCQDMATEGYYAHSNPRTGKHGYEYISEIVPGIGEHGENLSKGVAASPQEIVSSETLGWMGSPSHRDAMLSPVYTDTGFGICSPPVAAGAVNLEQLVVQHLGQLK